MAPIFVMCAEQVVRTGPPAISMNTWTKSTEGLLVQTVTRKILSGNKVADATIMYESTEGMTIQI